ncbi:isoleucine-tRNA synthetase [Cryptosporidium ubiquitum]|uniref:isoleucine--tRNA ligase n=1 Tax=Cryptosporidium ubiquitum TaxID=857276 RepID=A0A1J4MJA8_9CRYT|nr:isoleucine-tRNA synthetase [Cryptosporidium ubiquitum]OII74346.1 isoleucine-tRNA synthetase [Cryptosporidium ubiquitum]
MATFSVVSERPNFPKLEEEILEYWKKINILELTLKKTKGRPNYSFYDGPPFATGLPHYGHILAGTVKDVVTRYATQKGYYCERRFGWDCHGLPVEHEIDKQLNITSKEDVLNKGIDFYNESCRSIVLRYTQEWRSTVERVGRMIDFDNGYRTMDLKYMQTVWWVFKQLFEKNLVYRAYRVMPYSTACATPLSNFECNLNYKDVNDPSIIITFPSVDDPNIQFLAWTTTPWTLPSNVAIAVHPEKKYIYFKTPNSQEITYVIAESRLEWVLSELKIKEYNIISECIGAKLHNTRVIPLFDYFKDHESSNKFWKILADDYVTDNAGTGIVHMAPAFGEDDYRVCVNNELIDHHGINLPCPMDPNGRFTEPVSNLKGIWFKDSDKIIKQELKKKGRLLTDNTCTHSYPFCWRSDTPLQYRAVPSWFINVETLKDKLLINNEKTSWIPNYVKEKRFHNWLQEARDWCVSRNRFWGTPIPLWVSEDYTIIKCIESVEELKSLASNLKDKEITDIHRHFIDYIEIPDPRGENYPPLKRIEEVFDCWFESGSMPYASINYPFENKELFKNIFPADFVGEGLDQTRGWFYTLMVLSTALFDQPAFKNIIVNGLVLASDGKKMSKRLKNYPDPLDIVNKYGADSLRLFLINSPVVRAETLRFKEEGVKDVIKDVLLPWYHCYRFFIQEATRYENTNNTKFVSNNQVIKITNNVMDKWIYSEAQSLLKFVKTEMDGYRLYNVTPRLISFLDTLCNWYVRLNRDRMRGIFGLNETKNSLEILYQVLMLTVKLLAPFIPFTCELLYSNLKNALINEPEENRPETVHLLLIPQIEEDFIDKNIEEAINQLREIIVMGRNLREKKKVSVKTPLKSISIVHKNKSVLDYLIESKLINYIKDELNVLNVITDNNSEFSKITKLVATPNFKILGSKLGKSMKDVTNYIKNEMNNEIIEKFVKDGTIKICGFELNLDEIMIQTVVDHSITNSDSEIVYEGSSNLVIGMDFTSDIEFENMAYSRELANKIQKIRKEKNMDPDANVTIYLQLISNNDNDRLSKFYSAITSYNDYLQKIIRKPIMEFPIEESKDLRTRLLFECEIEVGMDDRINVIVIEN